ncbi:MAG: 4Fe-4S binding protein [Elusimicrobiota bacterium]|jgi:pyruvate ferredoxin oxidoreductase delta subunit|nr:4Fe-4S binding protein [Elusimicrobiota bacterium]
MKKEENRKLTAAEVASAGLVEAGTADAFHTGSWRSQRPIWNKDKCIHCLTCWISCPDSSINIAPDEKKGTVVTGIDYDHCKGCGICARECPPKVNALTMEQEKK